MRENDRIFHRISELHGRTDLESATRWNTLEHFHPTNSKTTFADIRAARISTAEYWRDKPDNALGWLTEMLNLKQMENWRQLQLSCEDLTSAFFSNKSNTAAWFYFESCRDPVEKQGGGVIQNRVGPIIPFHLQRNRKTFHFQSAEGSRYDLKFGTRGLTFLNQRGQVSGDIYRFSRIRMIPGLGHGMFDTWCAASSTERELLEQGRVPIGSTDGIQLNENLNIGILINWFAFDMSGKINGLTLELHPHTAQILSVRRAVLSFELFLLMHPRYEEWFQEMLDGEAPDPAEPYLRLKIPPPEGLPEQLTFRFGKLLTGEIKTRFNLRTNLQNFCDYAAASSISGSPAAAKRSNKGIRRMLRQLEKCLGVKLYNSYRNVPGRPNWSEPTEEGTAIAECARRFLER